MAKTEKALHKMIMYYIPYNFFLFFDIKLESAIEEIDRLYSVSFNVPDLFLSHLNVTMERVG